MSEIGTPGVKSIFEDNRDLHFSKDNEAARRSDNIQDRLEAFDSDNGGLSKSYQQEFLPMINNTSAKFIKWMLEKDLLAKNVLCSSDSFKCLAPMEYVSAPDLKDGFLLRCKTCGKKESIKRNSIFDGIKCDLRSAIRIVYGWIKGVDMDLMASLLGVDRTVVGTLYHRVSLMATSYMTNNRQTGEYDGLILIDIFPNLLETVETRKALKKPCKPILCIAEMMSFPQQYWLEVLDNWDNSKPEEVKRITDKIIQAVEALVKPEACLILPRNSTISLGSNIERLRCRYANIITVDDLVSLASGSRLTIYSILDTIWKKIISVCDEAQFYNPNYVNQFLVYCKWTELNGVESFNILMNYIAEQTRLNNIKNLISNFGEENAGEIMDL